MSYINCVSCNRKAKQRPFGKNLSMCRDCSLRAITIVSRAARASRRKATRNKKRAEERGIGGPHFTSRDWEEIIQNQQNSCFDCGARSIPLTVGHLFPLHLRVKGTNAPSNVVAQCSRCNEMLGGMIHDKANPKFWRLYEKAENHARA